MTKKNKKGKTEPKKVVGWKLRSSDEILAQSTYRWNTPDGKRPAPRHCRVVNCKTLTDLDEYLCPQHRAQLNSKAKVRTASLFGSPEQINARKARVAAQREEYLGDPAHAA